MLAAEGEESTEIYWRNSQSETCPPLGILIAGGDGGGSAETAEFFIPSIGFQCALPDLPGPKGHHAQLGDVLCGGYTEDSGSSWDCIRKLDISLLQRHDPFTRWKGGDWLVVGSQLPRGSAPGWQYSEGFMFFGGWKNEEEVDADNVLLYTRGYETNIFKPSIALTNWKTS